MKTKINTVLTICALGFIGLININATSDDKKLVNSEAVTVKEEILTDESWMSEKNLSYSAEAFSTIDFKDEINQLAVPQTPVTENTFDSLSSAESFTASGADQEIDKYAQKIISMQLSKTAE